MSSIRRTEWTQATFREAEIDKERQTSSSLLHAKHTLEVKYHISQPLSHSRASRFFFPCSLFFFSSLAFPQLPFHAFSLLYQMQTVGVQCHGKRRLNIPRSQWLLSSLFTLQHMQAILYVKPFLIHTPKKNRTPFRADKGQWRVITHPRAHAHTHPALCVLCALSEMYCLGKWVCAPSGGISMNKSLNALPYYSSLPLSLCLTLSLCVASASLGTHSPWELKLTLETWLLICGLWLCVCLCVCFVTF